MIITKKINEKVKNLPKSSQEEVLDFADYLLRKSQYKSSNKENDEWSNLSLSFAMRGMENEDQPNYTLDDVKENVK